MKIALDVMGGDKAPGEILDGAREALDASGELRLMLTGDRDAILAHWPQAGADPRVEIVHCTEVIEMHEHPAMAFRRKKDASITVATRLVAEEQALAVVSAGSTGAQLAAGLFVLGRREGVARPALATCIPTLKGPRLLLDIGANVDCSAENLRQFAWLGKIYSETALGIEKPRVYLLNNGAEEEKGNELTLAAYALLSAESDLGFCGNIEGRDMFNGDADVIVTDGFAGNIALKTMEGAAIMLFTMMKKAFQADDRSKQGAELLKPAILELQKVLDYEEIGGAPLLGLTGLSVVCHGSSGAKAIKAALLRTAGWVESGLLEKFAAHKF